MYVEYDYTYGGSDEYVGFDKKAPEGIKEENKKTSYIELNNNDNLDGRGIITGKIDFYNDAYEELQEPDGYVGKLKCYF